MTEPGHTDLLRAGMSGTFLTAAIKGKIPQYQYVKLAERQGFEPWRPLTGPNGFRDRPDRPLWHLSAARRRNLVDPPGFCNPSRRRQVLARRGERQDDVEAGARAGLAVGPDQSLGNPPDAPLAGAAPSID